MGPRNLEERWVDQPPECTYEQRPVGYSGHMKTLNVWKIVIINICIKSNKLVSNAKVIYIWYLLLIIEI